MVSMYQKGYKEETVLNQQQGHGQAGLSDAPGERSNRRASVAQINEFDAGSD